MTTKYSSSKRAIKPLDEVERADDQHQDAGETDPPTMLFAFILPFLPVEDPSIGDVRSSDRISCKVG